MTPETPTAQSGPSAFLYKLADSLWPIPPSAMGSVCISANVFDREQQQFIRQEAARIDAETPPAGARDAVTDALEALAVRFDKRDQWMRTMKAPNIGLADAFKDAAADIRALTGKAGGSQEIMPPSREPKTERDVRQALADLHREYQERCQPFVDILVKIEANKPPTMAWIPKATQPAATGAGECSHSWCDYVQAEYKSPPAITLGESNIARHVKIGRMCEDCGKVETNTAAPGMGELLADCKEKLAAYYRATGGEYPGGPALQVLNPRIDAAIAALAAQPVPVDAPIATRHPSHQWLEDGDEQP